MPHGPDITAQTQELTAQSQELGEQKQELTAQKQQLGADVPEFCTQPGDGHEEEDRVGGGLMPPAIRQRIAELSRRPREAVLRSVIMAVCAWKSTTSAELARLLGRRQGGLVRSHLRPMVESGTLRYTIPEMPNHPNQAYVASKEDDSG